MRPADLSLIENFGEYAYRLITASPSLSCLGQDLSTEDLSQLTATVQHESYAGKPVRLPIEFILEVKRVVPQKVWRQLATLLEKWHSMSKSQGENRMSVKEHEYLTMSLLWQTLLITECQWRHAEIQKEFAAIGQSS